MTSRSPSMATFRSCILLRSRLLILRRMVCSSFSDRSLRSFLDSRKASASSSVRPRSPASGESLCVDDTAPEKPCTDFFRVAMKMSSTSGDDGLLDTRLVSESMVLLCARDKHRVRHKLRRTTLN